MADETTVPVAEPAAPVAPVPAARLKATYEQEIRPRLQEEFGYRSPMEHPRLEKITLSMGVGEAKTNSKALDEALTKNNIKHTFVVTEGRHEWVIWRHALREVAPLMFK